MEYPNYICTLCPLGYYQLGYSYSSCVSCNLKPANSKYTNFTGDYYFESACNYTCDDGYELRNRLCLS